MSRSIKQLRINRGLVAGLELPVEAIPNKLPATILTEEAKRMEFATDIALKYGRCVLARSRVGEVVVVER